MQVDEQLVEIVDNRFWFMDIFGSWVEVGMVIAAVFAGLILIGLPYFMRFFKNRNKTKKEMIKFWSGGFESNHNNIHERLTELRVILDAGRTMIGQFHNGGHFIDGTSMRKFSITHESCALGVSSLLQDSKDELVTRYLGLLKILKNEDAMIWDVATMEPCPLKNLMEANHVVAFAMLPFHCIETGLVIGFIRVEWCTLSKADEINEESVDIHLNDVKRIIGVHLSDV